MATIFMGHPENVCHVSLFEHTETIYIPNDIIVIHKSAQPGDYVGDVQKNVLKNGSANQDFFICAPWSALRFNPTNGTEDYLWVTATKPSSVYLSPDTPVAMDGEAVWTTDSMSAHGLGFTVRWRAGIYSAQSEWVSPPASWSVFIPPSSTGTPFYQGSSSIAIFNSINCSIYALTLPHYNSLADFRNVLAGHGSEECQNQALSTHVHYSASVEVRYVLTKPLSAVAEEMNTSIRGAGITNLIIFKGRQASHSFTGQVIFRQLITINYPPWRTCTTGNVLVPLGTHTPNDLPSVGSPSTQPARAFDIELSNCPRVNIGYSFVAPVGIGYDSATGVVDLDSTAGNAEGVGIQIRHRNDPVYGNNTIVFNPSNYTSNPSYVRNWPQCQSQGTCTNNQNTGVNHSIPMQAAVYRKGNVTPGSINASILVHIVYP